MNSEWPVVTVDSVCDLIVDCVNKTAPVVPQKTPFRMIRTTNVRNGYIDLSDCRHVTEDTFEKWTRRAKLKRGDVILTREAPIGEVGLVAEEAGAFLGQRLMQYRVNPALFDCRFLLYTFLSPSLQHQFGSHEGSGSVVSHIRVGDCYKFKIPLPPLKKQKEISSILGELDDSIALLRETNKTLESIAQAIFKSWFVDFDPVRAKMEGRQPEGVDEETAALFPHKFWESRLGPVPAAWRAEKFGSVLTESRARVGNSKATILSAVQTGKLVRPEEIFNKTVHSENTEKYKAVAPLAFAYNPSRINIGSIGMNELAELGAVSPIYVVAQASSEGAAYLVWHHLRTKRVKNKISTLSTGTVRQSLSYSDFSSIELVIPPNNILDIFLEHRNSLYMRINANNDQIKVLTGIRDGLLPRLVSGQLRLPEAQEQVEKALS